jgi:hypothetical protein
MLLTERKPLRIWMVWGALIDERPAGAPSCLLPTAHVLSLAVFEPKENDKLWLKIDLCVVELLIQRAELTVSAGAIRASSAGMWCECNIGIKPEADTLDSCDLRRLLAGAFSGSAQVAA